MHRIAKSHNWSFIAYFTLPFFSFSGLTGSDLQSILANLRPKVLQQKRCKIFRRKKSLDLWDSERNATTLH
jgi:hypothetical protein